MPSSPDQWLDRHLARTLLRIEIGKTHPEPSAPESAGDRGDETPRSLSLPPEVRLEDVARAAAGLPLRHRIVFWLAVVERRRYGDITELLDETRDGVIDRIRESHRVIVEKIASTAPGSRNVTGKRHEM